MKANLLRQVKWKLEALRSKREYEKLLRKWPESLLKACGDQFDYAIGLKTGQVLYFTLAKINGDWIHLEGVSEYRKSSALLLDQERAFERGIDIHISNIGWAADAPHGS